MANDLIDLMESLTQVMDEETLRLQSPGRMSGMAALAAAKIRLVALLETCIAARARVDAGWHLRLDDDTRARLLAANAALCSACEPNARVLERQIDLSTEMMAVVASEAKRLTGARSATYGARGVLSLADVPTPISVNTRL
jgi:flagellar biosynthesis/type III secretory pathway chaperone